MTKETKLSHAIRCIYSGGMALSLGLAAPAAMAQQDAGSPPAQRVEITGSSIKRIAAEGALPVQVLSHAQIEQSGASNVADLIASLPAMQGFINASVSVNGGGVGVQTASIHNIGAGYTLVLLNGKRIAPATSGSTVNLASIPLAAVERVEILTDGANTLYGSDAIAGVVNFILKKNQTDLVIDASYNTPTLKGGGKSGSAGISKGWGELDKDGYNVLLSYSHDEQSALNAADRRFAKSGVVPFTEGGKSYNLYQLSGNSIPGNATVKYNNAAGKPSSVAFGPDFVTTGKCNGANLFNVGNRCFFDYAATVELVPELKRDSLFAAVNYKISDKLSVFAEAVASSFSNTARYAPPAQGLGIPLNSALYKSAILPNLARFGVNPASVTSVAMNLRLADAGGRTDDYSTKAKHLAFGLDGEWHGWDYGIAFTHSENNGTDTAAGGYVSGNALQALIDNGKFNPFAPSGGAREALAPAVLHNTLFDVTSKLDSVNAHASAELFQAPGGAAQIGVGGDITRRTYIVVPDAYVQGPNKQQPNFTDVIVGGATGALPTDASRNNWGGYAELLVPLHKSLELTASTRYDSYDDVSDKKNFDVEGNLMAPAHKGNSASKQTYKLALRYHPTDALLLRGSYGTGFKVADMSNIVAPLTNGGSSAFFTCPIKSASDPRYPLCNPGSSEYFLLTGGNPFKGNAGLRPEESKQATVGIRLEPGSNVSLGFDLWDVKLNHQLATLSQGTVFTNPDLYSGLLVPYFDPIQKQTVLAAALTPFNLNSSHYQGLDWDHTFKSATPLGKLNVNWTGTYMLKSEIETPESGVEKGIGRFDSYGNVTFRVISKLTASLRSSDRYTHSLTVNYHSGYDDQVYTEDNSVVNVLNADGSQGASSVPLARRVASYTTLDWQSKIALTSKAILTVGIKNLLNTDPPLSIRNAGGGNQAGFDARYTDPLNRQVYVVGSYKF